MRRRVFSTVRWDACPRLAPPAWTALVLVLSAGAIACSGGTIGEADTATGRGSGAGATSGTGPGGTGAAGGAAGAGGAGGQGGTALPNSVGWSTRYPRLTHVQWENTTRDLLRLDQPSGLSANFAPDPVTRFDTSSRDRKVTTALFADYQEVAEQLAATVTHDPVKLARILPAGLPSADPARAQAFVSAFGKRAFRRPLTADETASYAKIFQQGGTLLGGDPLVSGVEIVVRTMLQSPHFIYRIESSTQAQGDVIWLSSYEIATRLSYTLWNTMPSDELLAAADARELDNADGVTKWAGRMATHALAEGTIRTFHEQLLKVASFGSVLKDPKRFPNFTPALAPVLQNEARLFLDQLLVKQGAGIGEVLTASFTFVNDQTAPFYGLAPKYGTTMTRVDLEPGKRAGILTQVGFLATNGGLTQSDPIHRGVAVNFNLLCNEVKPPPDMVPPLPAEMAGQSNRQRIDEHTKACGAGCHNTIINPVGFAFEHYDAIGAWRDIDNALPIDATATFNIDGKTVTYDGAIELAKLISQSRQFYDCYAKNWMEYVLGRAPVDLEAASVDRLATTSKTGMPMRELLVNLTGLVPFRARSAAEGGTP
ncbi:MAG TPA: DUF1592 domain-containing protein [Polyangiaceae bacterium]|nr:DUF1592 domain-containing protein [Polyangiaceae bacterium]